MARGTEDITAPAWDGQATHNEYMHCDLHTANLYLGYRDPQHTRIPIVKIGDYGEMVEVFPVSLQTDEYGGKFQDRGARSYWPSEESYDSPVDMWKKNNVDLDKPRKGTCSNIWQAGAVMNSLLLRKRLNFNEPPATATTSTLSENMKLHLTHGQELEIPPLSEHYSKGLRALIAECLLRPPLERPSAANLVLRTRQGLRTAQNDAQASSTPLLTPTNNFLDTPILTSIPITEPPTAWNVNHERFEDGLFKVPKTPVQNKRFSASLLYGRVTESLERYSQSISTVTSPVKGGIGTMTPAGMFGFLTSNPTPPRSTPGSLSASLFGDWLRPSRPDTPIPTPRSIMTTSSPTNTRTIARSTPGIPTWRGFTMNDDGDGDGPFGDWERL